MKSTRLFPILPAIIAIALLSSNPAILSQSTSVVAPGAQFKTVQSGFDTTEGPAVDAEGNVYFTDKGSASIQKWTWADGKVSLYRKVDGGAIGMTFDFNGHLLVCEKGENGEGRITSDDMKGHITVLADSIEGRRLIFPNTVWVDPKGGIYFTEWAALKEGTGGQMPGGMPSGPAEPPAAGSTPAMAPMPSDKRSGVDYIAFGSGTVKRAINLDGAHKVILTSDGETLYASGAGDTIYTFKLGPDGTISGKREFCKQHCEDLKFTDGMAIDENKNFYTIADKIFVYNPSGEKIEEINLPEHSRNIKFAGKDRKTLFICGTKAVYTLEMSVKGDPTALDLASTRK